MSKKPDKYDRLKASGKLTGTLSSCRLKREERDRRAAVRKDPRTVVVGLGYELFSEVADECQENNKRLRNWGGSRPHRKLQDKQLRVETENHGNYSSSCPYPRYSYHPSVRSCAKTTRKRLLWFYRDRYGIVLAKRGWHFGTDHLGVYVTRNNTPLVECRYHFTMSEVIFGTLWANAAAHVDNQQTLVKKAKLDKRLAVMADAVGVYVTYSDSRSSGNCAAGTVRFCEQQGLDVRKAYPVEVVKRFTTGPNGSQVQRAIEAAYRRTVEDLRRGYCVINK